MEVSVIDMSVVVVFVVSVVFVFSIVVVVVVGWLTVTSDAPIDAFWLNDSESTKFSLLLMDDARVETCVMLLVLLSSIAAVGAVIRFFVLLHVADFVCVYSRIA